MKSNPSQMANSNPENTSPSFFKIFLDQSASNLRLPHAFVNKLHLEGKFPQNPVLKIQTGQKWRVEIETSGERACFGKGWLDFAKDTKIKYGDFLVFRLIDNYSSFQVYIFDPNGCLKDLSSSTPTTCKSFCSCSGSRIDDTDLKNTIKLEEEDDDGDTNAEEHDDDDHEVDGEKDIELQPFEGKEKSIKPCFQKVLKANNAYSVFLPSQFVHETGLRNAGKTILRNKSGREWLVTVKTCNVRALHVYISHGWADFRRENKLMEGDTCSFQYFHSDQASQSGFIQVEVVKEAARKSERPPWIQEARKRGRPPGIRPGSCSRSKITDADYKDVIMIEQDDDGNINVEELDDDDDDEVDGEKDIGLQPIERKERSKGPCFQKVLSRINAGYLELPLWFVRESGLSKERKPILRNKTGREWSVTVKTGKRRYMVYISHGWADFRRINKLMDGDTCSFQYFHGDRGNQSGFIQVEVVKKSAKKKRGKPPRIHPGSCSKSRITDADFKDAIMIEKDDDGNINAEELDDDDDADDDHKVDDEKDTELQPFEREEKSIGPCFQRVLPRLKACILELPQQFVRESGLRKEEKTILRNKTGREWPVTVKKWNCYRVYISRGWANFRTSNKLMEGDTCSFQYFHGDQASQSGFIMVKVVKKAARKRGRPPRIRPGRR